MTKLIKTLFFGIGIGMVPILAKYYLTDISVPFSTMIGNGELLILATIICGFTLGEIVFVQTSYTKTRYLLLCFSIVELLFSTIVYCQTVFKPGAVIVTDSILIFMAAIALAISAALIPEPPHA